MEKGNFVQLYITDLTDDGKGIGHVDGMAVFVDKTVPGDTVKAKVTKVKKRYAFADMAELITPSENRVSAACPYFGKCGGCALSEINYDAQLELKRNHVINKLERIGGLENPKVCDIIPCKEDDEPMLRYRNKAVFAVGKGPKGAYVGFKMRGSNMIVNVHDCLLQKQAVMSVATALRECINQNLISVYDEKKKKGLLREVTVKACEGSGEMMVVLTVANKKVDNLEKIIYAIDDAINEAEANIPEDSRFFLESVILEIKRGDIHDPANDYVVAAGSKTIKDYVPFGEDVYSEDKLVAYEISAPAFYQVNTRQMVNLYKKAAEYANLKGGETLFDIYCGIGTIGLSMADKTGMIVGIEDVKGAVIDANRNAVINGIVNARYYTGKAEEIMPRLLDPEDKIYADYIANDAERIVIIDPPRAGCDENLLRSLAGSNPTRIVYISCDPGTLARDIKILGELGYEFKEATPCDMFPFTMGIETVALLEK